MHKKKCAFMVLDGDEKNIKRGIKNHGYDPDDLFMPVLPKTSGKRRTVWWFSAAALYNSMDSSGGRLLYWGGCRFFDRFLKESAKWNENNAYFWSHWDRTLEKGVQRFNAGLGFYLPHYAVSETGELPSWLGNRFLYEYILKALSSKKIALTTKGRLWPAPAEELGLAKGRERLTLAMIVKDEQQFLAGCLEYALPFIDDIVVVDTGSADATLKIAEMYSAKIINHLWRDDFAAARNEYLANLPDSFVLCLDADEILLPETGLTLRALAEKREKKVYFFDTYNYSSETTSQFSVHGNVRLFYKDAYTKYIGRIHEQLDSPFEKVNVTDTAVIHYGYLSKIVKEKNKSERNTILLDAATKEQPKAFDFFNKGIANMSYSKFDEALDSFMTYFSIQDKNLLKLYPSAYWQAASAAMKLGKYDEALAFADKACETNLSEAFFVRAGIYEKLGELQKAVEDYVKASESNEKTEIYKLYNLMDPSVKIWRADYMAASLLEKLGRLEEASVRLIASHKGDGDAVLPVIALARTARKQGKKSEALKWAKKALDYPGDSFEAMLEHTEALADAGSIDEAFVFAEKCAGKRDGYCAIYLKLAELLRGNDNILYSCRAFEEYLKFNQENYEIITLYANCLLKNNEPEKALAALDIELSENEASQTAQKMHIARGMAHHALGNYYDAIDSYALAFDLGGENPELLFNIALTMTQIGRLEDALSALERLVIINSDYPGSKKLFDIISLKANALINS